MRSAGHIVRTVLVIVILAFASAMVVPSVAYAEEPPGDSGGTSDGPTGESSYQPPGGSGFNMPEVKQPKPPVVSCGGCVTVHPEAPPSTPIQQLPPAPTQNYVPEAAPRETAPEPVPAPAPVEPLAVPAPPPLAPPPAPVHSAKFTSFVDPGAQALTMILMFLFIGTWFYGNRIGNHIGAQWFVGKPFGKPLGGKKDHVSA